MMGLLSNAANFPTGRRDSRSPPRQALHDGPGRGSRYQDDMYHERDGGGYSRRAAGTQQYPRKGHDYGSMYDEGYREEGECRRDDCDDQRDRGNGSRHRDGDDEASRSPGSHRSYSPTRDAGRPSDTVILEGLPFGVSASELRESILGNSIAADFPSFDVRVSSSRGHRRAFVQFLEVDHATAFMREHFPKLVVELTHSTDDVPDGRFSAYIHYARSRDDGDSRGMNSSNWNCPSCDFSNYPTRNKCKICGGPQRAPNWQQSLTGVTDAANVPSQILVVYPLAPFVNEEMFAHDMKRLELEKVEVSKDSAVAAPKLKSTAPGDTTGLGARPGSLHRIFLIRDTITEESFKYGFAEFWTLEDATAAMTKFQRARSFTVAACPVTVSTIHMGVFVPEEREVTPMTERMSFNPLFNSELRVRYRDLHVYPSQLIVSPQPPDDGTTKAIDEANEAKKSKKRKAEGALPSTATKKSVPMAGQMAMWQKKRDELRGAAADGGQDNDLQNKATNGEGRAVSGKAPSGNGTPKDAFRSGTQGLIKISLTGNTLGVPETTTRSTSPQTHPSPPSTSGPPSEKDQASEGAPVSYVDRDRLMCLICMRKYKSVDEVNIHEKSRNHKTATENEELVKAALPRLAVRDKRLQKQVPDDGESSQATSQYRDRAKERRAAYSQPTKPAVPPVRPRADKKPPKQEDAPAAKPAQSKGAGMLAKMGWSTGAGLGASGDGRTEVIATNAYQEGVGLGAEGGNLGDAAQLAERKTKNSYADYVNTVQDRARERYNNMG